MWYPIKGIAKVKTTRAIKQEKEIDSVRAGEGWNEGPWHRIKEMKKDYWEIRRIGRIRNNKGQESTANIDFHV